MARIKQNKLIEALSGKVGQLVFKQYRNRVVISSAPDRSKVVLSTKQVASNGAFKEAVDYAKSIIADPKKKKAYQAKLKPGKSVYHAALAEYMTKKKDS